MSRAVAVHPEQERVEGHASDRGELRHVDAELLLDDRRGVEAVEGDHDHMVVTFLALQVPKGFGPRAAGLVDGDERARREVLFLDQTLPHAGHLVGTAAGPGHDDEFDGLPRLPCRRRAGRDQRAADGERTGQSGRNELPGLNHGTSAPLRGVVDRRPRSRNKCHPSGRRSESTIDSWYVTYQPTERVWVS